MVLCWAHRIALLALPAMLAGAMPAQAETYFNADSIPPALLPAPSPPESEALQKEIEQIIQLQQHNDAYQTEQAAAEREMSPEMIAQQVMPALTRDKFPETYRLLDRVWETTEAVTDKAKDYWHTKRPYLVDKRVNALIEAHDNPAYPSGHTSIGHVWAHVLGMLLPDKRAAFLARAEEIASHRVLVGMHFPQDIDGGKKLALITLGSLLQSSEFQHDINAAKEELAAGKLP